MELPQLLTAALAGADEEYLIGLSNKGTVNRAKKDLAALDAPEIELRGEGAAVRWGDVECVIQAPLGESRCSCPSSAVCRHRIAAILWLREHGKKKEEAEESTPAAESAPLQPNFAELAAYPAEKLFRQLGVKRLSALLFRLQSGSLPQVRKTSVVTVELPWAPATVRLLEPLEHSTCTCHSKNFCAHKAQALLCWKMEEGMVSAEMLRAAVDQDTSLSGAQEKGVCQAVQEMLSWQMTTGLSRMPDTVCDTVERMASLCHTAKLPELERSLRRLHREYTYYFSRSALYRDTKLLRLLAEAFWLAQKLERAEGSAYRQLAGTFRDEYESIGSMELYLLAEREVSRISGYSGTIYYFWACREHRFYTFSHLRPVQEGEDPGRWKPPTVVWNMMWPLSKAMHHTLRLCDAKASGEGKLSATEQCTAEVCEAEKPWNVFEKEDLFTDFSKLLHERSAPRLPETRRLALVCPARCVPRPYDAVKQVFSMELLDADRRTLALEFPYRRGEDETIAQLEEIAKQIGADARLHPVFFGTVYREDDRLKLFPIEIMMDWEGLP